MILSLAYIKSAGPCGTGAFILPHMPSWCERQPLAIRCLKRSTRPAVSITFPVQCRKDVMRWLRLPERVVLFVCPRISSVCLDS